MIRGAFVLASLLLQLGVEAGTPARAGQRPSRVVRERAGPVRARPVSPVARRVERELRCVAASSPAAGRARADRR